MITGMQSARLTAYYKFRDAQDAVMACRSLVCFNRELGHITAIDRVICDLGALMQSVAPSNEPAAPIK